MNIKHVAPETIFVVTIHDMHPRGYLAFDMLDVLRSLRDLVHDLSWIVDIEECTGEPIPSDIVFSFDELVGRFQKIQQTIDGLIVGWPTSETPAPKIKSIAGIDSFLTSRAEIAILAVDSTYFEVIAKDTRVSQRLRETFTEVRDHDSGENSL